MGSTRRVYCLLVIICVSLHITKGTYSTKSRLKSQKDLHESQNVKTIKTRYGDTYDCVDFYEQPAFKHPRLQNHKFYPEMRPNFVPNITMTRNDTETSKFLFLENGGCPSGTVPIKRLSKEDRSREAMFSKTHMSHIYNLTDRQVAAPGTHFAILQTKTSPSTANYYGVGAYMSVWNPQVKENQYSSAQITIQNFPDSLQVGWMVNPTMYKDTKTHMFIHTNAGESHCYNNYCPRFVLVRSDFPPDVAIVGYSEPGKKPMLANFFIYREPTFGIWWLLITQDLIPIGFWAERIFSSLNKYGTYISCGGETYSPPNQPGGYPPMGSGAYPIFKLEEDAFAVHFETANEKLHAIEVEDTEKFMDTKKYYVNTSNHVIYFGGYGG